MFADNLKVLVVGEKREEVDEDLNSFERCVAENKMAFALDKCTNLTFRGKDETYQICDKEFKQQTEVKNLDVMEFGNLNLLCHNEIRLRKASKVLCIQWKMLPKK